MLQIIVPSREIFDENTETFLVTKEYTLTLEHSLLSISKWESKWCKPFLSKNNRDVRTRTEMLDYVKCMTLNKNVPDEIYASLTKKNMDDINRYIRHPMTATKVTSQQKTFNNEVITSELIYYWMVSYQIPFECEKWHINRLLMLIKVCNAMNNPQKAGKPDLLVRKKLNAARRKALHSRG